MKLIFILTLIISLSGLPQNISDKIKELEIRGVLISKQTENNSFIFNVKSNKTGDTIDVVLPKIVYNSKEIYNFIAPGDFFLKSRGKLSIGVGHKFDGNIEVKQFNLFPNGE
jgi:hypothetical protein